MGSGIYFYRIIARADTKENEIQFQQTKKMVFVK